MEKHLKSLFSRAKFAKFMFIGAKMAAELTIIRRIKVTQLAVEVCDCLNGFYVIWTNCQRTFIRLPVPIPMGRIFRTVVA